MVEYKENAYSDNLKQQIQTLMATKGHLPLKAMPLIEETLLRMQIENLTLQEALGFSSEMLEEIYQYGYHLFQSGKYQEALPAFHFLQQLDNEDPRFVFAIAAIHHQMKHYEEAVGTYMLYELLDSTNPLPYYHMYDCFNKMNQSSLAVGALRQAHHLASQHPQYRDLKGKIELELNQFSAQEQL